MQAYDRIALSRSKTRPTTRDYIAHIFEDFTEMHGDRFSGDDAALICGIAFIADMPVTVIGIEKGHDLEDKLIHNFGCVGPSGYRKSLRMFKQAEKFKRPIVCFVDTQGAGCGVEAERSGIGQCIAKNLYELSATAVPVISIIIGEGGSGGALGIALSDEVWMLENAYYSVASPEAAASIIYKDAAKKSEAAEALKLFAEDLKKLNIVDRVISEPPDFSVNNDMTATMLSIKKELYNTLKRYKRISKKSLVKRRNRRFMAF